MNRSHLLVAALVVAVALAPGCITFYGEGEITVRVLVTRELGTDVLTDETVTLANGSSAMDALREVATVETSYGGGFIDAIDGLESRYPDAKIDWFYHVDTHLASRGAAEHTLTDGEVILFDHRSWADTMSHRHVLTGLDAWPVDTEDPAFAEQRFRQAQQDEATANQLYAEIDRDELVLFDAEGEPSQTLHAPWLLAHVVPDGDREPDVLLVASDEQAHALVDELATAPPSGVGVALTPDQRLEVPAG